MVSLTFDDGWDNQYATVLELAAHGMKGTYYVNTGDTGRARLPIVGPTRRRSTRRATRSRVTRSTTSIS